MNQILLIELKEEVEEVIKNWHNGCECSSCQIARINLQETANRYVSKNNMIGLQKFIDMLKEHNKVCMDSENDIRDLVKRNKQKNSLGFQTY